MKKKSRLFVSSGVLWTMLLWTGITCAAPHAPALSDWLANNLEPAVSERFVSHPRLRGSTVQVLAMRGNERLVPSNELSESIAQQLTQALTAKTGTRVVPPRMITSARSCMEQAEVHYQVAVEVRSVSRGEAVVSIRLFDLYEGNWVGGIGGQWHGSLSPLERRQLLQVVQDESTRGHRALPFDVHQPDLVARNLVGQLDCILARGARGLTQRGAGIALESTGSADPQLHKAGLLVHHRLAADQGWRPVAGTDGAALRLRLQAQALDDELSLVWVTLEHAGDAAQGSHAPVLARAQTYVRGALPQSPATEALLVQERIGDAAAAGRAAPSSAVPASRAIGAWSSDGTPIADAPLLGTPRLLRGAASACGNDRGRGPREGAVCDLVEVDIARRATVFWLRQPAECELPFSGARVAQRFTEVRTAGAKTLSAELQEIGHAVESMYVIAVEQHADASALRRVLTHFPDDQCASPRWPQRLRRWALALESTLLGLGEDGAWEGIRLSSAAGARALGKGGN